MFLQSPFVSTVSIDIEGDDVVTPDREDEDEDEDEEESESESEAAEDRGEWTPHSQISSLPQLEGVCSPTQSRKQP